MKTYNVLRSEYYTAHIIYLDAICLTNFTLAYQSFQRNVYSRIRDLTLYVSIVGDHIMKENYLVEYCLLSHTP